MRFAPSIIPKKNCCDVAMPLEKLGVSSFHPPSRRTQSCDQPSAAPLDWHRRWGPLDPQANSVMPGLGARGTPSRHSITILIVAAIPGSSKRSGLGALMTRS